MGLDSGPKNLDDILLQKDPKEEVIGKTKDALVNEKTEFEKFKEVMKLKDGISKKVSSITKKVDSLEGIPTQIKEKINNSELQDLLSSNIYELEDVSEKREALEFLDSFLGDIEVVLEKAGVDGKIDFSDVKLLTEKLESKFDDLKGFIGLDNGDFEYLREIAISFMLASVVVISIFGGKMIGGIGILLGVLGLPLGFRIGKFSTDKAYEKLDQEYGRSFLMDKLDDYIPSENISKSDFELLYRVLEEELGVYESKDKILTQMNSVITPEGISFSSYIEDELKNFINENPDISDDKKLKEFINYLRLVRI